MINQITDWIFSTSKTLVTVAVTCSFFLNDGNEQKFESTSRVNEVLVVSASAPVLVDASLPRAIHFQRLVAQWKAQKALISSITAQAISSPYQRIIAIGPDAVPLIIGQLKSEGDDPDQWFWALRSLTGINPVKPEDRGNFRKMADAWINWAESRGFTA